MDVGREWKLGRFEKGDAQKEKEAIRGDVATPAARFTNRDALQTGTPRVGAMCPFLFSLGGEEVTFFTHFIRANLC